MGSAARRHPERRRSDFQARLLRRLHDEVLVADETSRFRADGTSWDGESGENDDGRTSTRVPARRRYVFAWWDDHGADSFYHD